LNRYVGQPASPDVLFVDVRRRLGTKLTKRSLLVLHPQIPFHTGSGPGISLTSFAGQPAFLGWMVTVLRLKTRGKLTQGFWAIKTSDFRILRTPRKFSRGRFFSSPFGLPFRGAPLTWKYHTLSQACIITFHTFCPVHKSRRAFTHYLSQSVLTSMSYFAVSSSNGGVLEFDGEISELERLIRLFGVRRKCCSDQLLV